MLLAPCLPLRIVAESANVYHGAGRARKATCKPGPNGIKGSLQRIAGMRAALNEKKAVYSNMQFFP